MKNDLFTVKQVAKLANVTIKALHHYDAMGLLRPIRSGSGGYRLYGHAELERLQQILFYRELGFPLKDIQTLLTQQPERLAVLLRQRDLLRQKQTHADRLIATLDQTIGGIQQGTAMTPQDLFEGFHSEAEWKSALSGQTAYLKETYDVDVPDGKINVQEMNVAAREAVAFNSSMIEALKNRVRHDAPAVQQLIGNHIAHQAAHGHASTPQTFAAQTRFFLTDDFHHDMLETWHTGLSYFLHSAAQAYADKS